ncbi:MAG: hypothetical protein ACE5DM_05765, partial [Candidatus Nanoarchaeia archaeon]
HPIVRQNAAHLMNAMVKYEKRNGKVPESNDYTTLNNLNTARTAIQCMSDGNLPPAVNENCAKLACEASSERSEVSGYMVIYTFANTPKRVRAVASACVDLNNPATLNTVIDKITKPGAKGADGDNVQVQALTMATKWYQNRLEDLKKSCRKGKTAKARKKSLQTCRAEIASHKNYAYGRLLDLDMQLISDQKESKAVRDIAAQSATTIGGRDLVIRAFLTRHNYGSYLK